MSGFGTWLLSKLTLTTDEDGAAAAKASTYAWMHKPEYACVLKLPLAHMNEEDVDPTFKQLTVWADKEKAAGWFAPAPECSPAKREHLAVRIAEEPLEPNDWPNGFQFSCLSRELAHWLRASFPTIRWLTLYVWKRGIANQVGDTVGNVLLAPNICNGVWCHTLTILHLGFREAEVAWSALARLDEFTALKNLYLKCKEALCPSPSDDELIEGPRQALLLPCLAQLERFEFDSYYDEFSAISYSLLTYLPPATHKRTLWLTNCVIEAEFDGFMAELSATTPTKLSAQICEIYVELPGDEQAGLNNLVRMLPNLAILHLIAYELSLLVIMRALAPLHNLKQIELELKSSLAQLVADDMPTSIEQQFKPKMDKITHLTLYIWRAEHGSIKAALLQELFPSASIDVAWLDCATCGTTDPHFNYNCWNDIVVGNGIGRAKITV